MRVLTANPAQPQIDRETGHDYLGYSSNRRWRSAYLDAFVGEAYAHVAQILAVAAACGLQLKVGGREATNADAARSPLVPAALDPWLVASAPPFTCAMCLEPCAETYPVLDIGACCDACVEDMHREAC